MAHEAWAKLISDAQKALRLVHVLVARIGLNDAVAILQENLSASETRADPRFTAQ